MASLAKQILNKKALGVYGRKFFFFFVLFLIILFIVKYYYKNIAADQPLKTEDSYAYDINFNIEILENGQIKVNGQETSTEVDVLDDVDELRLPIVDNPGRYYDKVTVELMLPKDNANKVEHSFLGIHGVGDTQSHQEGGNKIVYVANDVSQSATLTIVAQLPKGTVKPSIYKRIESILNDFRFNVWLLVAIALPLITFIFLVLMIWHQYKRQKIEIPDKESNMPPMSIPPAIVGVLFNQRVTSREIAATLIDLALRGDIVILDRERGFAFGKGRFDQRLLGYEKILLSKIFKKNLSSDRQEIEERINNHFYSKKISLVSSGIYTLATRLGYFKLNPQKYHAKYRFIGIFLFLIALGGFVLNMTIFTEVELAVFFWVGMMIASLIISFIAGNMPIRTVIGQEVLSNWLAFKKFLTNPEPFPYSSNNQEVFQRYLPYAIVMNCETAWAKRFYEHNFIMPDWFLTEKGDLGLEDFCLSLFPIVSYVGRSLASIREPGFE